MPIKTTLQQTRLRALPRRCLLRRPGRGCLGKLPASGKKTGAKSRAAYRLCLFPGGDPCSEKAEGHRPSGGAVGISQRPGLAGAPAGAGACLRMGAAPPGIGAADGANPRFYPCSVGNALLLHSLRRPGRRLSLGGRGCPEGSICPAHGLPNVSARAGNQYQRRTIAWKTSTARIRSLPWNSTTA